MATPILRAIWQERTRREGYQEISRVFVLEPTLPFGGCNVKWSPPAYADGHIFVRSGKEMICASLTAGR